MKTNVYRWLIILIVVFTVPGFLFTGCGAKKAENNSEKKITAKIDSIAVVVVPVENKKLSLIKIFTGSIEGEEQANLVSRVSERIVKIPVKVGDNVKADQVLIFLDKKGMTSQYNQAFSALENAEKDLKRMKNLYESGAVSQQSVDGVQTLYNVASANFDAAKNAVEITSPISGVVTSIKNNVGDFTAPGNPIITVARISSLKLVMSVGEADLPYISQSKNVKIYSELNPSLIAEGKLSEISKSADVQTRTFEVKALFPNRNNNFMPGMFAKAELELSSHAPITVVPRQAVVYSEEGAKIFVVTDGKAYSKKIKTGLQNDSEIEVLEGLNAGETIVKIGTNNLRDGIPVVITKENLLSQN